MNRPQDLIELRTAADLLGVSIGQARRYVRSGKLTAWRRGGPSGRVLVSQDEVEGLIAPVEERKKLPRVKEPKRGSMEELHRRAVERLKAAGFTV